MIKVHGKEVVNRIFVLSLLVIALVLILNVRFSAQFQLIIFVAAAASYLAWALVYHYFDKSLTLEVFLEYVLTALLALVLLIGVIL